MDLDKINQLQRLGVLRGSGALSEEEFQAQKAAVLGTASRGGESSPDELKLKRLELLRRSGALSDEECAVEKARILRPATQDHSPDKSDAASHQVDTAKFSEPLTVPVWAAKPKRQNNPAARLTVCLVGLVLASTAFWWFQARPRSEPTYVVTSVANVRSAPTTEHSLVVDTLTVGETVRGEWVSGRNGSRWLRVKDKEEFVWEGNLKLDQ